MRLPQIVKRSISNKSFLGALCLSSVSSWIRLLSSDSSGVVRNWSDSLVGSWGAGHSSLWMGWVVTEADMPSSAGSPSEGVWTQLVNDNKTFRRHLKNYFLSVLPGGSRVCLVRFALLDTLLGAAEGGFWNSFSSIFASFTYMQDFPNNTILFSTFRVIILNKHTEKHRLYMHYCSKVCDGSENIITFIVETWYNASTLLFRVKFTTSYKCLIKHGHILHPLILLNT